MGTMYNDPKSPIPLHLPEAAPSWGLILQSGVRVPCTVGIPLSLLLRRELQLSEELLWPVETLLLDGSPVDEPDTAIVPDGARLALAAGLPGIAGLAMKSGSAVRALRGSITRKNQDAPVGPTPGSIILSLYSLVLPILAPHFLKRGVIVSVEQLRRYSRFAQAPCGILSEHTMPLEDVFALPAASAPEASFFLTADMP